MKNILKAILLLLTIQLAACSSDGGSDGMDAKTKMLTAAPWGNAQVTHSPDGDLSDQYTDFAIMFTANSSDGFDGTFVVSNGGYAFSENAGRWRFNDDFTKIIFDSEKEMDIELSENHLQLDFIVAPAGGKVAGISGHFVFDLQPL